MVTALFLGGCSSRTTDEGTDVSIGDESGLDIGAATDGEGDPDEIDVPLLPEFDAGNIRVFSDPPALLTGDTTNAVVTAVVTDEENRAIANHEVSFSSDGGALQNIQAITNEFGEATAELNLAGDFTNKSITVNAVVQEIFADVLVAAQGSALTMTAPEGLVVGDTADLQFTLLSGAETGIPNQIVQFISQAGNTFSQNSAITNSAGVVDVSMTTSAGTDVISAIALDGTAVGNFDLEVAENIQAVVTPVKIRVISDVSVIETGGSDIATITALVTDEDNRVISDKEVLFSSTGGILQNISGITNEAGQAVAELNLAGDFRNQNIIVNAVVDDQSSQVLVTAQGTDITIAGPTALVSGDTAELAITLVSGDGQPVSNEQLSIRSTAGNTIQPQTATTDSDGNATVIVDSRSGTDRIIVSALDGTVAAEHNLQVAADILAVVPGSFDGLPVSEFSPFSVEWTSNGFPVPGQLMRFSTTAGVVRAVGSNAAGSSSIDVLTSADGVASVELSSNSAGPATISFADSSDGDPASQFEVEFVATVPASMTISATPASVSTDSTSTISAVVVDAFGNPVKDTVVEFSSADLRGGSLSPVSALTDQDGTATITFNAGSLATETDGIIISAEANDFPVVTPASVGMTVTEEQLNVIIGLSGQLSEIQSDTRYSRTGVIQVTDGAGRPVSDATILLGLAPTVFRYGQLFQTDIDGDDTPDIWRLFTTSTCEAEDANGNRILDAGEDLNGNGILDPRDPALIDADPENAPTVSAGVITTDESGVGFFTILYPQSNALYFDITITARVEALGTEAVANYDTALLMSVPDIENLDASPPNRVSPFGPGPAPSQPGCV